MFVVVFLVKKMGKKPLKCPSAAEYVNRLRHMHKRDYYASIKRD